MSNENDELLMSFVEEASEVLADVENDFLAIEEAGENIDVDLVNKVFRGIHSMKGSAGFLGLKSIGTLAHEMENILNLIRNQELVPNGKIVDSLLRGADALRSMVADVANSNDVDVSSYIELLKSALVDETSDEIQECQNIDVDIPLPDGGLAFVMIKKMDLVLSQRQGCHIYVLKVDFFEDVQAKNRTPMEFLKSSYEYGELIDSYMSTAGVGDLNAELPESMDFVMLYGSKMSPNELAEKLDLSSEKIILIATEDQQGWGEEEPAPAAAAPAVKPVVETPEPAPVSTPKPAPVKSATESTNEKVEPVPMTTSSTSAQTNLRVNVKVLDTLMNLAGELVLGRNQLLQEVSSKDFRGIDSVAARIDQVTSELQEAIMQTRMQPIGTIFNKFPRLIRDLSNNLGKQCELTIEGKDVEMDKTIIEAIGDPLTHLIRNSIDHGIETPDVRDSKGKDPTGNVILKAYHQAGKVNIAIIDDGGGMDAEKLRRKAVEKGIYSQEQARELSERDAIRLIFHPGFSTAEKVTDVSGRGVGMDVVRTNIERLGGTIDIDTEIGVGTTITVKLPLTLAIIPSLIVRCGLDKFAIPQGNISELVRIKAGDVSEKIERVKDAEVLRLRGSLLPLIRLNKVLDIKSKYYHIKEESLVDDDRETIADRRNGHDVDLGNQERRDQDSDRRCDTAAGALNIIVVETGHLRYGMIVDELFDSKEIVVKPLDKHMKDCQCLAGATILGDGKVSLILDIAGIASYRNLSLTDQETSVDTSVVTTDVSDEKQSVLVFNNAEGEYFGVPNAFISRIERIRTDQIDSVGGQEVLQYRGSSLPLLSLEQYIQAKPRAELVSVYVVVFKISGHEAGLIAPNLVDISEIPTHIDTSTFKEKGVVGSTIQDERTIRLIDVYELAEKAHPEWIIERQEQDRGPKANRVKTILLAEDSTFFRQQMMNFLEADGYEVTGCEDGVVAWDVLQNDENEFDIVVTDVEMPNMDGLELTKKVKNDPRFSHLPVIAVTSLASDDDIEKGQKAGVDEYQVKLDREKLLQSIAKYTKRVESGNIQ